MQRITYSRASYEIGKLEKSQNVEKELIAK